MKNKWIVLIAIIAIIIIIACFYHYGFYYFDFDKAFSKSSESLRLLFSFITFIIALKIYDRFGVNRKIVEKRIELIVELLIELKKLSFRADRKYKDEMSNIPIYVSKDIDKYFSIMSEKALKSKVAFYFPEKMNDCNEIKNVLKLIKNPLMPPEIYNKLIFMEIYSGTNIRKEEDVTKIYYTDLGGLNTSKIESWIFDNKDNHTLEEYLNKFKDAFLEIESWIKKHSNLSDELNI